MNSTPRFTHYCTSLFTRIHLNTTRARLLALIALVALISTAAVSASSPGFREFLFGRASGDSAKVVNPTAPQLAPSGLSVSAVNAATATVTTDKSDYNPGDTVVIGGSGWTPGEAVALHIDESDGDLPWDSSATADGSGNITNSGFVIQTHDVGVAFTLTATGGTSGFTAFTSFTDVVGAGIALNGDPGGFEIQGGVVATLAGGHTDWVANGAGTTGVLTAAGAPIDTVHTFQRLDGCVGCTSPGTADDVFDGSNKLNQDPNFWKWHTQANNQKSDMNNVYVHLSQAAGGHHWITASGDRESNNGTAFIDFELLQNTLTRTTTNAGPCVDCPNGGFTSGGPDGGRTVGDILLTGNYNSGGSVASIIVLRWQSDGAGGFAYTDITSTIAAGTAFVATNTADGASVPYTAFNDSHSPFARLTTYNQNEFIEMSVDLDALIGSLPDPCTGLQIKSIMVKTKTSTSTTATMEDLVLPIQVDFNAGFVVSATETDPDCSTGLGTVTGTFSGGKSPYQCKLDSGSYAACTSPVVYNNVAAGPHTVTVKESGGCEKTSNTVTVTIPTAVITSATETDPDCSTGLGSMTVTFSGGTPGYQCKLDAGAFAACTSPAVFNNLAAGSHTVSVKDSKDCPGADQTKSVTIPTAVTTSATETDPDCSTGTGSMTVTFSGGTPGYQCKLDAGAFAACTSPAVFNNLAAGSHTVSVKDSKGCAGADQTKSVTIPTAVTTSATETDPDCSTGTGSMTVTFSGGTPGYTCSLDGGAFAACTSPAVFNNLAAGSHTVSVKDSKGCPGADQTKSVTIPTAVTTSATETDPDCSTGTGSMTVTFSGGTPGYTCSLDGGAFAACTSPAVFNNLAAGSHTVSVKDSKGCPGADQTKTVTIPPAVTLSLSKTDISCHNANDGTVTATFGGGTGAFQCQIDGGGYNACTSPKTFMNLGAGTHTVDVKDAKGCPKSATSDSIVNPTALTVLLGDATCANNGNTTTITATPSGGTPGYSYHWTITGGSFICGGSTCADPGNVATVTYTTNGGALLITVKVTDGNGCTFTQSASGECRVAQLFCTLTQGAYGNKKGQFTLNGTKLNRLDLITQLLEFSGNLILGVDNGTERSLTILDSTASSASAQCIINRMPAGTQPFQLYGTASSPIDQILDNSTCDTSPVPLPKNKMGRWADVLLGQTLALSLNIRLSQDNSGGTPASSDLSQLTLCKYMASKGVSSTGLPDSTPECGSNVQTAVFSDAILAALDGFGNHTRTVGNLLAMANAALAGEDNNGELGASITEINDAVTGVNELFDECRYIVYCDNNCPPLVPVCPTTGVVPNCP